MTFWVHKNITDDRLLDGRGFPVNFVGPSTKTTIWADKDAAMAFMKRTFKGETIIDKGNQIEVALPADHSPARTLGMVEITI